MVNGSCKGKKQKTKQQILKNAVVKFKIMIDITFLSMTILMHFKNNITFSIGKLLRAVTEEDEGSFKNI